MNDKQDLLRCKDCKYYSPIWEMFGFDVIGIGDCMYYWQLRGDEDTCKHGEWKDEKE